MHVRLLVTLVTLLVCGVFRDKTMLKLLSETTPTRVCRVPVKTRACRVLQTSSVVLMCKHYWR